MQRKKDPAAYTDAHYHGFVVAERIRKGLSKRAEPAVVAEYVRYFWEGHLAAHIVQEEELLLPLLQEAEEHHLADRMLDEHALLRDLVQRVQRPGGQGALLHDLARMIRGHIRFEEREVYPAIQRHFSSARITELQAEMRAEDGDGDGGVLDWEPAFWK